MYEQKQSIYTGYHNFRLHPGYRADETERKCNLSFPIWYEQQHKITARVPEQQPA